MIEVFGKFTAVAKLVEDYEIDYYLNISDDAEFNGLNTTMYVEYTLQPFVYVWGIKAIECCITNVTVRTEFSIDIDTLSEEEVSRLEKLKCWIDSGNLHGVINFDTKNHPEWKIVNELAFLPEGGFTVNHCVIDFKLKQINIS